MKGVFTRYMENIEEFDKLKTKVLKYVLYKKRSENEVRTKFSMEEENLLDEVIDFLKENQYIDDSEYIERAVEEFKRLKNMSIKEIQYKLYGKGLNKEKVDNYIYINKEDLIEYELNSARQILIKKKSSSETQDIYNYLRNKGFLNEIIRILQEEEENNE